MKDGRVCCDEKMIMKARRDKYAVREREMNPSQSALKDGYGKQRDVFIDVTS